MHNENHLYIMYYCQAVYLLLQIFPPQIYVGIHIKQDFLYLSYFKIKWEFLFFYIFNIYFVMWVYYVQHVQFIWSYVLQS